MYTLGVLAVLCVCAPLAAARGCTGSQRHALAVAGRDVAYLSVQNAPGSQDAAQLVQRALHRCSAASAVQALVHATRHSGLPRLGQVRHDRWFVLVGAPTAGGTAWRLDLPAMLTSSLAASSPSSRARKFKRVRQLAFLSHMRISWSSDPTRRSTQPAMQARAARALALKGYRADAVATALSFRSSSQRRATLKLDLLSSLSIAIDLAVTSHRIADPKVASAAHSLGKALLKRVRAADSGSWSLTNGAWSTLAQHRVLIARGAALEHYANDPATETTIASLRHELVAQPVVSFSHVPELPFYPWPRDGTLDASALTVTVDKPSVMTLNVFDLATGAIVRSTSSGLLTGSWETGWDGTSDGGTTLPPGSYLYGLVAADLAGNKLSAPGLNSFVIARDVTPPAISLAQVKLHSSARRVRQLRVRWNVTEPLSPLIQVTLVLTPKSGVTRTIALDGTALARTIVVPVTLPRGRWRTTLIVTDGSGNRTSSYAGALQLPR